ncbi:MAG: MFS transporter [Rhodospirillales bacterium]|nr:MFS transporter [Rhodospirillales bacterium]
MVLTGTAIVPFDSAVNVAFPAIIAHFRIPIAAIQWVVVPYTLTYAALTLIFGRLGDLLGHKRVFLAGAAISMAGYLGCAFAPSYALLIGARIIQGIGAALVLGCGAALATALYPDSARVRILGLYTMAFGLGSAGGPLLGGLLVGQFGWASVFWFRAPFAALALLGGLALPRAPRRAAGGRFDALGGMAFIVAMACFDLGLSALQPGAGGPLRALALGVAACAAAALFLDRQRRARAPLIALAPFAARDFRAVNAANVLLNLAAFSILLLLPFYFDRVLHLSTLALGAMLALSQAGVVVAAPLAARLVGRLGRARLARYGAAGVAAGQIGILLGSGITGDPALLAVAMAVVGLGLGTFQLAYFDLVTARIPAADRGVAASLVMVTRTLGLVIGASLLLLLFRRIGGAEAAGFLRGLHAAQAMAAALAIAALLWLWRVAED